MEKILSTLGALQSVLGSVWQMMCSVPVPGLGSVSFGAWFLAGFIAALVLALLRDNFGVGGSGTGQRSGQSRTKYISKERKNDEK